MSGYVGTTKYNYRRLNGLGFIVCAGAIAFTTAYLQEQLAQEPCILCSLTRLITLSIASIFLLAFLHNPGSIGQRIYGFLAFLLTLTGISATLKHVWIQAQLINGSSVANCEVNVSQVFDTMPTVETLSAIFQGASECHVSQWTFLGLSIPEQALMLFSILLIITWKLIRRRRQSRDLFR
ncbi:disulfide bond formation protein B [Pontibacterium granulatum]|uniref:disulfide bond formation protein B n=1 Tax=Pontibacterium granulatum TaxID=2036029 RepID=UPI002499C392|nr:disulfide bond formation protein B [Pontibacterium granulatum]MDI3326698.1 disulfide bond formation protein B [Pontibacterium granulatum]